MKNEAMKAWTVEPGEWWNDCGVWRVDNFQGGRLFLSVVEAEDPAKVCIGAYGDGYFANDPWGYYDPMAKPSEGGFAPVARLTEIDRAALFGEDGDPVHALELAPEFCKQWKEWEELDDCADSIAFEYSQASKAETSEEYYSEEAIRAFVDSAEWYSAPHDREAMREAVCWRVDYER